jgi:membrane-associated progesterone receptor component
MEYVEQRMNEEAAKGPASAAFVTPLNIILLGVVAYTCYSMFRPAPRPVLARDPPPTVFRTYTPRTLLPFSGEGGTPVYLAVRGRVYDVSRGRNFYGPGGPYSNFAGRDASRGLAKNSFDEDMLTKDLDGPLDDLQGLGPDDLESLEGWDSRFSEKYDIIGRLVSAADYEKEAKA